MRKIKFRAWIEGENRFSGWKRPPVPELTNNFAWRKGEYTLEQYTGLNDKNGVEIYVGDIVKHTHPTTAYHKGVNAMGVIQFVPELASYRTVTLDGFEEPIHPDVTLEVMGNIHENPSLLAGAD